MDLVLLCEEAGVDPGKLGRLVTGASGPVTVSSLSGIFPGVERHLILGIISVARRAGAIEAVGERGIPLESRKWKVKPEEFRALTSRASVIAGSLPAFRELLASGESYRVAATIPAKLGDLDGFYAIFENTVLGMRRLIEEAKKEVYIVAPFLDREGVEALFPTIETALRRDIKFFVLARRLSEGDMNRHALAGLIAASKSCGGSLSLFESEAKDDAPFLHAKILARDAGEEVYVGSANLTGFGMERTLEVGVFLRGGGARAIYELLTALIGVARRESP